MLVLNCDREFHDDEQVGKEMVEKVCIDFVHVALIFQLLKIGKGVYHKVKRNSLDYG